jgi:hypothetical protein
MVINPRDSNIANPDNTDFLDSIPGNSMIYAVLFFDDS